MPVTRAISARRWGPNRAPADGRGARGARRFLTLARMRERRSTGQDGFPFGRAARRAARRAGVHASGEDMLVANQPQLGLGQNTCNEGVLALHSLREILRGI